MDLDLATTAVRIAEHRARVARVDRFGSLLATGSVCATSPRASTVALTVFGSLLRAIGAQFGITSQIVATGGVGPSGD
jgi:hypothetical protein